MDNPLIKVECSVDHNIIDVEKIINMLPQRKTIITQAEVIDSHLHLKLLISAQTANEIMQWLDIYEEKTKTTYSVRSTEKCSGRYVSFKQRRYCQHNTNCGRVSCQSVKGTKNTNCPSKMTVTLKAIKARHRHKNKNSPDPEFPCEVEAIVTHNHDVDTADDLKFRPVSEEVRQTLIELYQIGHTPATALEIIKMNIRLHEEDYEKVLADRKYCPNYQYCHYVYTVFKEEYEQLDFNSRIKEVLMKMLSDFNMKANERSAEILFEDNNYIMCVCPPMMKRAHVHITSSSEMVLIDSSKTVDGSKIFILLTPTECGGLPLGVIITSSESVDSVTKGLNLLRYMVGDVIFNGNTEGPKVFLTSDSPTEKLAVKNVWPKSKTLLCSFDVLQTVWRWLIRPKNNIPQQLQHYFFQEIKAVLYAKSVNQCIQLYNVAKESAKAHPNYCKFLGDFWQRKELWAFCYRSTNHSDNNAEVAMKFLKEKLFHGVKTFNVIQMVHFITTKFIDCHVVRLLNIAKNQLDNVLDKPFVSPPDDLVEKIQCLSDNMALVPSEDEDFFYIVNTDVLMCTCFTVHTIKLCKHIDWTCCLIYSQKFIAATDDMLTRTIYYKIATGEDPEWLLPFDNFENDGSFTVIYIPDGDTSKYGSVDNPTSPTISEKIVTTENSEDFRKCKDLMGEFMDILTPFCENSPQEMLPALEQMKETLCSCSSVDQVVKALSNFGHAGHGEEISTGTPVKLNVNPITFKTSDGGTRKTISKINRQRYVLSGKIIEKLKRDSRIIEI